MKDSLYLGGALPFLTPIFLSLSLFLLVYYYQNCPSIREGAQKAIEWCTPATNSSKYKVRNDAFRMLSYIYLHLHEYDLAEKSIRETLSGVYGDTDTTLAAILMHKGNITEAEKMYQRCLFKSVNECINALTGLSGTAGKLENEEHFLCYEKMILTICDLFYETNLFGTKINPYLSLCHYYGAKDMEEEFIYYLERLVESINTWSEKNDLSSNTFFFHLKSCDNTIFSSLMGDGVNEIADAVEKFQGFEKQEYITELLHQLRNRSI